MIRPVDTLLRCLLVVAWLLVATALLLALALPATAADPRYCGPPARAADHAIARRAAAISEFRRQHPCPVTSVVDGACPGWAIDHVIPLACEGCDSIDNMQWLPTPIKSSRGSLPKDRWERRVYCVKGR